MVGERIDIAALSEREQQVLTLSTQGLTDKLIAKELSLSIATVHTYWLRIKTKLGGATRAEIVADAVQSVADQKSEVLIEEIRRRARVEEELMESHRLLQSIIDATPDLIFVKDLNGRYEWVNRTFQEAVDRPIDEILGRSDLDLVDEETAATYQKGDLEAINAGEPVEIFDTFQAPGGMQYYHTIKFPLFDDAGKPVSVGGVSRNITARVESEREAARLDEQIAVTLNAAMLIFWEWNIQTNEVSWSKNTEAIHGIPEGSFDGTLAAFERLVDPRDLALLRSSLEGAIAGSGEYEAEFRTVRPDGALQWIMGKGRVFYDEKGAPLRIMGIGKDITRRKIAEDLLLAANSQAK